MLAAEARPTEGGGTLLTADLRPAVGARVRITNESLDARTFRLTTDSEGAFRFRELPLTPWVDFHAFLSPFYETIDLEVPRQLLEEDGIELFLEPIRREITGRVLLDQEGPVAGAELFAVAPEGESYLGSSDEDGVFQIEGVPLQTFGSTDAASVSVRLPDRLTFARRFEPGPEIRRRVSLSNRRLELGDVEFRALPAPEAVELSGFLYVRDSLEPRDTRPVDGLLLQVVDEESSATAAEVVVEEGEWSFEIPPGVYRVRAPGAEEQGFMPLDARPRHLAASRSGIRNGLQRLLPTLIDATREEVAFSYPEIPDLEIEEAVLRIDGEIGSGLPVRRTEGHRYAVVPDRSLQDGAVVEVAVRIEGLLTMFSRPMLVSEETP